MAKNLEQIIQKIPLERQKKIEERASELIAEEMTLKLSIEDSEAFVEALLNPPEPNEPLKAASQRHQKLISVHWI
jgi:uncharacterized protein (DUF1778 family)